MSLYKKYRPDKLSDIFGNEDTIVSLETYLDGTKEMPQALLFQGPTGCGKTTMARIVGKELEIGGQDLMEIDSGQFRGIDTIREIRKQSTYRPLSGDKRMWIIDECHKLSNDAQNALLKILEDTPKGVYFILCTTEPNKLISTILNRCVQYTVKPLDHRDMFKLIKKVVKAENETIHKSVYEQIIMDSLGRPRDALQILDKVLTVEEDRRIEVAKKTAEELSQSIELCRALIQGDPWKKTTLILKGLKEEDPERIRRHILGYLQSVLLDGKNDTAAAIMEEFLEPFYNTGFPGLVYACYRAINL